MNPDKWSPDTRRTWWSCMRCEVAWQDLAWRTHSRCWSCASHGICQPLRIRDL